MSFYKQYPKIKESSIHVLVNITLRFFTPIVFLHLSLSAYFSEGMTPKVYLMIGLVILSGVVGHFVTKNLQKTRYLIKYGTKKNVICTKVKTRYKHSHASRNNIRHIIFYFSFISIDGNENTIRYSPLIVTSTSQIPDIKIKEGDSFPIVFNPENPKDCAFDIETFKSTN